MSARRQLTALMTQVQTFLDMHQVISAGPFLYVIVQEVRIKNILVIIWDWCRDNGDMLLLGKNQSVYLHVHTCVHTNIDLPICTLTAHMHLQATQRDISRVRDQNGVSQA